MVIPEGRHLMAPYRDALPLLTKVARTQNTCPCRSCVDRRRRWSELHEPPRTGAFNLAAYPHIDALLAALIATQQQP